MNAPNPPLVQDNELQAYVDGQLPADRAAIVEAFLAQHPDVANRIGAYRAQNQQLHELFDGILDEPIPQVLRDAAVPQRRKRPLQLAAVAASLVLGGAAGFVLRGTLDGQTQLSQPFADRAVVAHRVYTAEVAHPVEVGLEPDGHLLKWLSKRLGHNLRTPDFSQFGYALMGGRLLPGDSGAAAQFMYQTDAGSRLTLYVTVQSGGTGETQFARRQVQNFTAFVWHDRDLGFALVGDIDPQQLDAMAHVAYGALGS